MQQRIRFNEQTRNHAIAPKPDIADLLDIMARLRDPETGCPWDVEQDFSTIAPYTIEEAYEVADAIEQGDLAALKDELGDLLFQVVFHARMAEEKGAFDFGDVVAAVCDKMLRRHPHVFARQAHHAALDAEAQRVAWEEHKDRERADDTAESLLDHVPRGLAELQRSVKLQKRAAKVGFDWGSPEPVLDKLAEETAEMHEAMATGDAARIEDELGDLLFVLTNLARQLDVDPARALRGANAKFERRFREIERVAGDRAALEDMSLDEMEALWQRAKRGERNRK
jgi:ATP diphosphatase